MTIDQANKFITEVLRGLWQRWEPQDTQIREWAVRLCRFDYAKAERAVKDLFFSTSSRVSPPADKIMRILKGRASIPMPREETDPVMIFSIIRERDYRDENKPNFLFTKNFCVGNKRMVPAREEIEYRAGVTQRKMNEMYGENHIVILPPQT